MTSSDTQGSRLQLELAPARLALGLWAVTLVLTAMHVTAMLCWYLDLIPIDDWLYISFFDLDEEESFGTWYNSLLLLLAGLLSMALSRSSLALHWKRWWLFLGCGFVLLSVDEIAGLHEFVNTMSEGAHWTTFGIVLVGGVGLAYLPFLWAMPPRTRWLLLASGAIYVGGAVVVERATIWHELHDQLDTLEYNLSTALEEFLEMSGVVLYLYTLLDYFRQPDNRPAVLSLAYTDCRH